MEERRRTKKRKAEDHHCQGGSMHTKREKKKKKEEQRKQRDANATTPSSSRDYGEEGEERSHGISEVFAVKKKLCKSKEHKQAQHDGSCDVHVDCNAITRQFKKVRFSDQLTSCEYKRNVSDCTQNSIVFKGSSANGCEGQASFTVSCSCKKETSRKLLSQDGPMTSNASQVGMAIDEKSLFTCNRQKDEDDEIWGKRFTSEEDELLKNAVMEYIKVKGWEKKEGIGKVMNCKKHKEAHNCWGVIRLCLPRRPRRAILFRAYRLFEEYTLSGQWSKEEGELLKRLHKEHGNRWKNISTLIGRSQYSISTKWRCLKRPNPTGVWTWDELQQLSDLVHKCLRLKALGVSKVGAGSRRILRDNISWDEIADAIGTHNHGSCCTKWYCNLSSSMVIDGLWASEDDYLLLRSLLESGACTEEEVEWQRLLNHRSGQACLVRWKQMVKHLGENRTREFLEKLDSLVRRYAPELLSRER